MKEMMRKLCSARIGFSNMLNYFGLATVTVLCVCAFSACSHEHTPGEWIVDQEPTCTETGSKYTECEECGEIVRTKTIEVAGHTESEWIVEVEATYTTEGSQYRECSVCGEKLDSRVIPATAPMNTEELAAYVQERTVCMIINGQTNGTGFFIDENGTLVTCFHVIEDVFFSESPSIEIELSSGARYAIEYVVKFDPAYDLAVIKIDTRSMKTPYLALAKKDAVTGTKVYACGAALGEVVGNFTDGQISSASKKYGLSDSYISNAATSGGNSGGPLVNASGEVIGVTAAGYEQGENMNIFIKTSNLDKLRVEGNKTLSEFVQWFSFETRDALNMFIYSANDKAFTGNYYNSYIHSYHDEVGAACVFSSDDNLAYNGENTGYESMMYYYTYEYVKGEYSAYVEYLKSEGYNYKEKLSGDQGGGVYLDIYYNEISRAYVEFVTFTWNGQRLLQLNMYIFGEVSASQSGTDTDGVSGETGDEWDPVVPEEETTRADEWDSVAPEVETTRADEWDSVPEAETPWADEWETSTWSK